MPVFTVTTWEHVEGTYRVEADDEATARRKFEREDGQASLIDWRDVTQIDYQAFEVEVREAKERAA